jgi:hypothetical protein
VLQTAANPETQMLEQQPRINQWLLAEEAHPLESDIARNRAQKLLGILAVHNVVEPQQKQESASNNTTLLFAAQAARMGDQESRRSVEQNVQTNVAEILYKAGHQTSVALTFEDGQLSQSGRSLAEIQANTLRYSSLNPLMRQRSEKELENVFSFEELLGSGALKDYDAVVFSLAPSDEKTKRDYGFFSDTDTCSIQLLRHSGGSDIELQTALVAGKTSAQAARHDSRAVEHIARQNGASYTLDSEEDSLRQILLIPKESVPSGVVDIVKQYDAAAGGTFYGEQKINSQLVDYSAYAAQCEQRNRSFDAVVRQVTDQLLDEASGFSSPIQAIKRLHKLTEQALVAGAISDESIDTRVFGAESAGYIDAARLMSQQGNAEKAIHLQTKAIETAVSSSCPMFQGDGQGAADSLLGTSSILEDKYGSLEFTCKRGHTNTRPRNTLLEKCQRCGISVRC